MNEENSVALPRFAFLCAKDSWSQKKSLIGLTRRHTPTTHYSSCALFSSPLSRPRNRQKARQQPSLLYMPFVGSLRRRYIDICQDFVAPEYTTVMVETTLLLYSSPTLLTFRIRHSGTNDWTIKPTWIGSAWLNSKGQDQSKACSLSAASASDNSRRPL